MIKMIFLKLLSLQYATQQMFLTCSTLISLRTVLYIDPRTMKIILRVRRSLLCFFPCFQQSKYSLSFRQWNLAYTIVLKLTSGTDIPKAVFATASELAVEETWKSILHCCSAPQHYWLPSLVFTVQHTCSTLGIGEELDVIRGWDTRLPPILLKMWVKTALNR